MWYAVNGGGDAVFKVMLSHGVDINAKNSGSLSKCIVNHSCLGDLYWHKTSCTNLHDACWAPTAAINRTHCCCRHAKSSPAHKIYEDAKSQLLVDKVSVVHYMLQNWTALHHAACDENEDLCKLLIFYGADKTAKTTDVSRVLLTSMHSIGHATALVVWLDAQFCLVGFVPLASCFAGNDPLLMRQKHRLFLASRHSLSISKSRTTCINTSGLQTICTPVLSA